MLVNKRLCWALALSVLVHLVLALFITVEPPEPPEAPKLTARFEALPPPPSAGAKPPKAVKKTTTKPVLVTSAAPVAYLPEPEPADAEEVLLAVAPLEKLEKKDSSAPTVAPEKPVETQALAQTVAEPEKMPEPKPKTRQETLPRVIDLQYSAGLSKNGSYPMTVGNLTLRFTHEAGRYELSTVGRARGFFAIMYPGALKMISRGTITEKGIRPDKFTLERNDPSKTRHVVFDWEKKLVTIRDKEPVPISEPTFDALTFIIQFYFSMPNHVKGEPVTLQVASPTRLDEYTLKREEEVSLQTPLGEIHTERWLGTRKTAIGQAEFWLAPKWHYIPFKVALTSEHGDTAVFSLETVAAEDNS
ncbi:MAG: hypothetical protein RLZZ502_763 [Pseudomonadota bacterium]